MWISLKRTFFWKNSRTERSFRLTVRPLSMTSALPWKASRSISARKSSTCQAGWYFLLNAKISPGSQRVYVVLQSHSQRFLAP